MFEEKESVTYPLLPLRGLAVFPYTVTPLEVARDRSLNALERAMEQDHHIVLATQRDPQAEELQQKDLYGYGVLCEIKQLLKIPNGQVRILVEGLKRVRIDSLYELPEYYEVEGEILEDTDTTMDQEMIALLRSVLKQFENYVKASKRIPVEVINSLNAITEPSRVADTIAAQLVVSQADKMTLLSQVSIKERLETILELLGREADILELERKIHLRVRKQIERNQREFHLREQIKAIQKELGEGEDKVAEVQEYKRLLKELKLPKEAKAKVAHEIARFERMPPMAVESVVIRNYLEWMLSIPWSKRSRDRLDVDEARVILDNDHYGLLKVKERILEFLAVRQLTKSMKGPILCLVGPPGVGKTSLARSVASALNRKFTRLSLGGVRDEAEIRGHRKTYVGALPGKIIQSMKVVGTMNPVILLDEVDKMTSDFRGDPASALLEVLDPEQNHTFGDHYLEVPYDLSGVLFLTTANVLHNIPVPLRDRMEMIEIPGYTEYEKLQIAKGHLWPKQVELHGLSQEKIKVSDGTISAAISDYTKEAGVRSLERQLATICRKVAVSVVQGNQDVTKVTASSLSKYLGRPRYKRGKMEGEDRVGVATGLAYTSVGGDLLSIEVTVVKGKGKLTLTGNLGDVMRESAQAATSYIRSRVGQLGIVADFHEKYDIHIHVPEGAIPKDGPSAGITMATALASALSGRAVRKDVAMTGEITLRGRVLAIGGVKEKLLAAHRGQVYHILLPQENEVDLEDVPDSILKRLRVEFVSHMDEVLAWALIPRSEEGSELCFIPVNEMATPWLEQQ